MSVRMVATLSVLFMLVVSGGWRPEKYRFLISISAYCVSLDGL